MRALSSLILTIFTFSSVVLLLSFLRYFTILWLVAHRWISLYVLSILILVWNSYPGNKIRFHSSVQFCLAIWAFLCIVAWIWIYLPAYYTIANKKHKIHSKSGLKVEEIIQNEDVQSWYFSPQHQFRWQSHPFEPMAKKKKRKKLNTRKEAVLLGDLCNSNYQNNYTKISPSS